jgi:hypothetical protein
MQSLRTLPDHLIALMFCDKSLGDDLRESRRLNDHRVFDVSDACAESGRMYFEPYAIAPDGSRIDLDPVASHGTVLNPYDRDRLWVYTPAGGYIGASPRRNRVSPHDPGAIRLRLGQISHDKAAMLAPLRERHADAAAQIAELQAHNRAVKDGAPVTPEAKAHARRETRQAAAAATLGEALRAEHPPEDPHANIPITQW